MFKNLFKDSKEYEWSDEFKKIFEEEDRKDLINELAESKKYHENIIKVFTNVMKFYTEENLTDNNFYLSDLSNIIKLTLISLSNEDRERLIHDIELILFEVQDADKTYEIVTENNFLSALQKIDKEIYPTSNDDESTKEKTSNRTKSKIRRADDINIDSVFKTFMSNTSSKEESKPSSNNTAKTENTSTNNKSSK